MISLGRGFFNFHFENAEDQKRIWSTGTWNVKPGVIRMQPWSADFNPNNQRPTNAQVWVRLHDFLGSTGI